MLTRRELLTVIAVLAASPAVGGARQSKPNEPKLTTVTLVISGMT